MLSPRCGAAADALPAVAWQGILQVHAAHRHAGHLDSREAAYSKVPLRVKCKAAVRSGPALSILSAWSPLVCPLQIPEAEAKHALKEKPKDAIISLVTITCAEEDETSSTFKNFLHLRQTLQTGKMALMYQQPFVANSTQTSSSSTFPVRALTYVLALDDLYLTQKKLPANSLECFVLSHGRNSASGSSSTGSSSSQPHRQQQPQHQSRCSASGSIWDRQPPPEGSSQRLGTAAAASVRGQAGGGAVERKQAKHCKCCNEVFFMEDSEARWYEAEGIPLPVRCKECRVKRKAQQAQRVQNVASDVAAQTKRRFYSL